MNQKRYFKEEIESIMGEPGIGYYEYNDEFCTRQIKAFANRIQLYRQTQSSINIYVTDQPLNKNSFAVNDEISQSEFESVWVRGVEFPNLR